MPETSAAPSKVKIPAAIRELVSAASDSRYGEMLSITLSFLVWNMTIMTRDPAKYTALNKPRRNLVV